MVEQTISTLISSPLSAFNPLLFLIASLSPSKSLLLVSTLIVVTFTLLRRATRSNAVTNSVLRALRFGGPIPEHVAFIMDGNRRWARRFGLPPSSGHPKGGEKLIESLQWCLEAGVRTLTVFAFSIENFKRSSSEVDELMSLAERTFHKFSSQQHIIHERRVRVRVLGDLDLVPESLRCIFARVMNETRQYTDGPTLNICFAYASRYDIASAVRDVVQLCHKGVVDKNEIDENLIAACLASGFGKGAGIERNIHPDLLVRTSGETRLSDFLLWEASNCVFSFYSVLWPDFSAWDLVKIILEYQDVCRIRTRHYGTLIPKISGQRNFSEVEKGDDIDIDRRDSLENAVALIRQQYFDMIDKFEGAADRILEGKTLSQPIAM